MKKGVFLALLCAALPGFSLDWELPVVTVKYEMASGQSEEGDEEELAPSSRKDVLTLSLKEAADPALFGLGVVLTCKDFLLESGDWDSLRLTQDGSVRLGGVWRIGYTAGMKWTDYADPDSEGVSKDGLSLSCGLDFTLTPVKGTSLETGFTGRFALPDDPLDSAQAYTASLGLSTRMGQWLLSLRYKGQMSIPLGSESAKEQSAADSASISLQWDPNR
jgi:hypothetical protein